MIYICTEPVMREFEEYVMGLVNEGDEVFTVQVPDGRSMSASRSLQSKRTLATSLKRIDAIHDDLSPEMRERADRLLAGLRNVAESFLAIEAQLLSDWKRVVDRSPRFKGWRLPDK